MSIGATDLDTNALDQQSLAFTQRATSLIGANGWLDHQTATVLAQQPTSDVQMHQQAQAVGDALAQPVAQGGWDGYEQAFFDPTLQAQPSTAQAVADYLHSTLGPPAVSSGSITQLQSALAKDGYLTPAQVSGVWDSSSESAYNQAVNSYKTDVLSGGGGKPLTSKVSSMVHALFHDASHPWDAVSGYYDSVVQAVGDVAGAVAGTADDLSGGNGKALFNSVSQHTLNALTTGNTSAAAQAKYHSNPLNFLGDAAAVAGVTGIARSAVKGAVVQGLKGEAAGLTKTIAANEAKGAAAQTTAEHLANIAKLEKIGATISGANRLGFVGNSINDIGDALRAGTLPSTDPLVQRKGLGIVTKTLLKAPGGALKAPNALVSSKWLSAVPGLARLAPVTAKIGELGDWAGGLAPGTDGFVFKARNLAAIPYRYAPVRAAGIAYSRAEIGSLAAHGVANLLPGSGLQANVDRQNHGILDSLADATIIPGLHVTTADLLTGGLLHGDLVGANTASKTVGKLVSGWTNGLADKMGALGVPAAFTTALGVSRKDLLEQAGGDSGNLLMWMNNKVNAYAADEYATRQVGASFDGGKADQVAALKAARDQWYQLPAETKQQWMAALTKSDPHLKGLQTRIKADVLRDKVNPKSAVRASMDDYFSQTRDMQDLHSSGALNYVISPTGHQLLAATGEEPATSDLAQLTAHPDGALGLQGVEVKTKEEVQEDAANFQDDYAQATTPAMKEALITEMVDYLHTEFNMDASHLGVFERNPSQLIAQIEARGEERASEVLPSWDQPQWVKDRIDAMKASGKRVVLGSHIGHAYDGTLPQLATLDGWKSPIRRWAGKVALEPQRIPDIEVGKAISQSKDENIHQFLATDPKARLATQHADFRTARVVLDDATKNNELNPFFASILALTSKFGLNKAAIDNLVKESGGALTSSQAREKLESAIGAQFGIRDVAKSKLVDHLMTTRDVVGPHGTFTWQGVDKYTATGIVNAALAGYRQPTYMMGLEGIENFARAGFGIGDKLVKRNPDNPLYQAVSNWPNAILRARNQLRFTVSPLFAARVATKVRYKALLEGVQIPFNPLKDLSAAGNDKAAMDALTRLDGKVPTEQMDADRYAQSRDIFGIHDSHWDAAYFVHAKQAQGLSPDEVKAAYQRVFTYGAEGGRSALERSANTIFFPFSFDKTLYRNTGAYLLDHPTQALIVDNAVDQWRILDRNQAVGKWVDDHLPILKEMQLLNGFSHGLSPGQFGGINAPIIGAALHLGSTAASDAKSGKSEALLNLLLPQAWGKNFTVKNLEKYAPIWNQAGTFLKAIGDQADINAAAAHDAWSKAIGSNAKPEPMLTPFAQIQAALGKKASLINDPKMRSVIDYNAKQGDDADKYTWPQNTSLPQSIWGKPINRTTISAYVQYLYPAYDPQSSADFAVANQAKQAAFIRQVAETDPGKAASLTAFAAAANKLIGHLNDDSYDTATARTAQNAFHDAAQGAALSDPVWNQFYTTYYKAALGPITSYNGKAAA